jgi:hypothetical protein
MGVLGEKHENVRDYPKYGYMISNTPLGVDSAPLVYRSKIARIYWGTSQGESLRTILQLSFRIFLRLQTWYAATIPAKVPH